MSLESIVLEIAHAHIVIMDNIMTRSNRAPVKSVALENTIDSIPELVKRIANNVHLVCTTMRKETVDAKFVKLGCIIMRKHRACAKTVVLESTMSRPEVQVSQRAKNVALESIVELEARHANVVKAVSTRMRPLQTAAKNVKLESTTSIPEVQVSQCAKTVALESIMM